MELPRNVQLMDNHVIKEYLIRRGFVSTFDTFVDECEADPLEGFEVHVFVNKLLELAEGQQFGSLLSTWRSVAAILEGRSMDQGGQSSVTSVAAVLRSLEVSLLRLCIVRIAENEGCHGVRELVGRYREALQPPEEWHEWMALQYVKNPKCHPRLSTYFSHEWQSVLRESLYTSLKVIMEQLELPTLLSYNPFVEARSSLEEQARSARQNAEMLELELQRRHSRVSEIQAQLAHRFQVAGMEGSWGFDNSTLQNEVGASQATQARQGPFLHIRDGVFPAGTERGTSLTAGCCSFSIAGDYIATGENLRADSSGCVVFN